MAGKYQFVCRVCLVKDPSSVMHSLVDQPTRKLLFKCTTLWVTPGDKYPQQLCTKCWNKCTSWSVFQALARDSDRRLRLEEEKDDTKEVMDDVEIVDSEEEHEDGEEEQDEEEDVVMVEDDEDSLVGYSLAPEEVEEGESELESDGDEENGKVETTRKSKSKFHSRFKCRYCPKLTQSQSTLTIHERVHTNERPFPCEECGRGFKTNSDMKRHQLIHSGVKAFKCDQCYRKFTRKDYLHAHKQTHHTSNRRKK